MDVMGECEGGMNWEIQVGIYILPCVKKITNGKLLYSTGSSLVLCGDLDGLDGGWCWEGGPRGREYI